MKLRVETLQRISPVLCSEQVQDAAKTACQTLGIEPFSLPSGAGHDGMQLKDLCRVGMIFIRSRDGISHSPRPNGARKKIAPTGRMCSITPC